MTISIVPSLLIDQMEARPVPSSAVFLIFIVIIIIVFSCSITFFSSFLLF